MKISEIDIPDAIKGFYTESGISELYPPQEKAVEAGLLEGRNILAAVPTASGKTMIAEMAMLKSIINGGKCLYIVPLRALASEKYARFREFEELNMQAGVSTGDLDSRDEWLGRRDIIVATSEKTDSLIRNGASWIKDITVIVADEVHLLDSPDRGPTLEITLARLMQMNPDVQIIALSATVGNAQEMAQWLDAALVESKWRPIDLLEGVFLSGAIKFQNSLRTVEHKYKDELTDLVYDTLDEGGQCLVFESSRRNAEASARRLGQTLGKSLGIPGSSESSESPGHEYSVELDSLANRVLDTGETEITRRLAQCVRGGAAFHHAGLLSEQRKLIEDGFRNNLIKVLSSTPTLAAGLNMPARRVIIKSYRRYDPNYGMVPIPVLEYKQMAGRAGRPGLDPYGESVLISKSDEEMEVLIEQYVNNNAEDIYSKLGTESALRTHILSIVSTGLVKNREELMDFLGRTFFGYQQDTWKLAAVVDEVIEFLVANNLVIDSDGLHPTELGELVTKLYIDPMSASTIMEGKRHLGRVNVTELTLLQLICNTPNMRPLYLRNNDYSWLDDYVQQHNDEFVAPPPPHSSEYEWFMSEVKTAVLLLEWISESKEDDITSRFNIGPGDIRAQADTAQWLMHSTARIFSYLGSEHAGFAEELVERISYGAAKELLPIIKIKGIGRVRARKLYNAGYKDIEAIRKEKFKALADIIGPKIAANTLRQLGIDVEPEPNGDHDQTGKGTGQQNIIDF
ncbi:MAG: ATP-dependent DNA helicase [ANME-2 cluster archaeon]|nr:ATP-dependent DNA helicase [ANME-2 cluster archaeon]MBC2700986.1 ATP-dependent DNA helicase [ANME-2 cluster archaeon]MBC2706289.1 ATP-dependent DNA helicase [ANME-2 cluster archaeon]MBC2745710.1 ATP-dependent DNA helicase [ANME-2 cluster archaeon]MBC2761909.1 ATP-dependent DNA helicase [ANME-2 cluster archaeon]